MTSSPSKTVLSAAVALGAATELIPGLQAGPVDDLINKIKSKDDTVRGPAWQNAGPAGAPAVKPLAGVMTDADFEVARSARRALWNVVHYAGRPGATKEAKAVTTELLPLLTGAATPVRREVVWMLSEVAGDEAIDPMAVLLSDSDLREDARCALTRMPGRKATAALKKAMDQAPEEFKYALAESLRVRGEKVTGYPSRRLVPTKPTEVKPA